MHYLKKTDTSRVLQEGWQYSRSSDRPQIRDELLIEQSHYCAYSERFVDHIDAVDIEHFDPRLKHTDEDSNWNWYAVLHWMNQHKPHGIERYEPLPKPYGPDIPQRLRYVDGLFLPKRDDDLEVDNLIRFLGWNKPEVVKDRCKHVQRVLKLRDLLPFDTLDEFVDYLRQDPHNLSFRSALEAELNCHFD